MKKDVKEPLLSKRRSSLKGSEVSSGFETFTEKCDRDAVFFNYKLKVLAETQKFGPVKERVIEEPQDINEYEKDKEEKQEEMVHRQSSSRGDLLKRGFTYTDMAKRIRRPSISLALT